MNIESLWGIATWGDLAWDPIRDRLYFTESRQDKAQNRATHHLMMVEAGPDATPVPLTAGPSDTAPAPSPDGRWLGFLSRRSGSSQVWRLPLEGGEARQVTAIAGGVRQFRWAPGSDALVAVAHIRDGRVDPEAKTPDPGPDAPDSVLDEHYNRDVRHITHHHYKLDGEGFFDAGRNQLVWVDVESKATRLLTDGRDNYAEPVWHPDGRSLFCLHRFYDPEGAHPGLTRVERRPLDGSAPTILPLPDWSIASLAVDADGQRIAFSATDPEDHGYGLTVLYAFDLGSERLVDLSSATDRPVGDHSGSDIPVRSGACPVWQGDDVLWLLSDEGRVQLAAFSTAPESQGGGVTRIADQPRVVYDFAVRGSQVALGVADSTHPSGLVVGPRDRVDQSAPRWAPVPWGADDGPVAPSDFWATESDGTRVHTWCLLPSAVSGQVPTVLEIHGGPASMYAYRYFHEFQCLAAAGHAVVYSNPRGSVGYGREFGRCIMGQWGDRDYRDVMAALDAALQRVPELDPQRLGVAGGSYGGFMVNWIVSHTDRFRAGVTMRSVVNRLSAMGSSDMGWLRVPQYGTRPWWEDIEPYWQQSPLRYASAIHTPLLIEHQEQDYRLPIEQGEQLYNALKYLGREVELVIYPGESHGMSRGGKPWHRIHRLHTIVDWFHQHL